MTVKAVKSGGRELLQEEQQQPSHPTLQQTPPSLPPLPPLPCRHLMARLLLRLPGPQATPSCPVMTPSSPATPTWPPLLWWLQLVTGCPRSLEVENKTMRKLKGKHRTRTGKLRSSELSHTILTVALCACSGSWPPAAEDWSLCERISLIFISHFRRAVQRNVIWSSHQISGTALSACCTCALHCRKHTRTVKPDSESYCRWIIGKGLKRVFDWPALSVSASCHLERFY